MNGYDVYNTISHCNIRKVNGRNDCEKTMNNTMKATSKPGERSSERRSVTMIEKKVMSSSSLTSKAAAKVKLLIDLLLMRIQTSDSRAGIN